MDKKQIEDRIQKLELEIFLIEMKDSLELTDYCLMDSYRCQIEALINEYYKKIDKECGGCYD